MHEYIPRLLFLSIVNATSSFSSDSSYDADAAADNTAPKTKLFCIHICHFCLSTNFQKTRFDWFNEIIYHTRVVKIYEYREETKHSI